MLTVGGTLIADIDVSQYFISAKAEIQAAIAYGTDL
jgi:hypothetical protein